MIIVDCVSDLHGHYPELEGGDLLIVAGDLTDGDTLFEHADFDKWQHQQNYRYKIIISGNHDNFIFNDKSKGQRKRFTGENVVYLCDSGVNLLFEPEPMQINTHVLDGKDLKPEVMKSLKVWGSPWTKTFPGMNPHCKAFTVDTEEELEKKWALIPQDVDILITHCPPWSMLDYRPFTEVERKRNFFKGLGSYSLTQRITEIDDKGNGKKRLLVCGHIHEGYGVLNISNMIHDKCTWKIVNASHMTECYEPVNKPIRITL